MDELERRRDGPRPVVGQRARDTSQPNVSDRLELVLECPAKNGMPLRINVDPLAVVLVHGLARVASHDLCVVRDPIVSHRRRTQGAGRIRWFRKQNFLELWIHTGGRVR